MQAPVVKPSKVWRSVFAGLLLVAAVAALLPSGGELWFPGLDKLEHCLAYTVFYLTGWLAYPGPSCHWRLYAGLLAYGIAIELLQSLTGYRFMELADLFANAVGMALGTFVVAGGRQAGWLRASGDD